MIALGALRRPAVVAAALLLSGCVNFSALDDLETAQPPAAPFAQALYQNYAFLAHSFGDLGQANYTSFDQDSSYSLTTSDSDVAALANSFADKALQLSRGEIVDPEPSKDLQAHNMRDRLVRALPPGSVSFPRDAARAQSDYDCWQLNAAVASQTAAAARCRKSLDVTLPRLENEVNKLAAAKPAPATPATPATSDTD